jgi:predicted dienelactone hydrolase
MLGMAGWDLAALALTAAALILGLFAGPSVRAVRAVTLTAAVAGLSAHLALEGARWQMAPVYGVLLVALVGTAVGFIRRPTRRRWPALAGVAVLALAAVGSVLFPVFHLPRPTGPYPVGVSTMAIVDRERPELHTANPVDTRAFNARIWYPAAPTGRKPAAFRPDAGRLAEVINRDHWPFGVLISHLNVVPTVSVADAPVSRARPSWPVLIFSHGLTGLPEQNTALMQDLASRGYVVVSLDHAFDAMASVLPDGRAVAYNGEAYAEQDPPPSRALIAMGARVVKASDPAEIADLLTRMIKAQPLESRLSRFWIESWSADQSSTIDQLARLQAGRGRFAGRLDLSRIGVFGMSFGGAAAMATCARDPRCKAGANIDGFRPVAIETPPQRAPSLYFSSDDSGFLNRVFLDRDLGGCWVVKVRGAHHLDFTDAPRLSPLAKAMGISGTIAPDRTNAILTAYLSDFFGKALNGEGSPALDGRQRYPETTLRARPPR